MVMWKMMGKESWDEWDEWDGIKNGEWFLWWWWWLMVGGFLKQGSPRHQVSILKWSSMTWMIWGTTMWGNLHLWILKFIDDLPSKFSEVPDVWQMFLLNGPFTIYLWDMPPSFTDCYKWFTWIYLVKICCSWVPDVWLNSYLWLQAGTFIGLAGKCSPSSNSGMNGSQPYDNQIIYIYIYTHAWDKDEVLSGSMNKLLINWDAHSRDLLQHLQETMFFSVSHQNQCKIWEPNSEKEPPFIFLTCFCLCVSWRANLPQTFLQETMFMLTCSVVQVYHQHMLYVHHTCSELEPSSMPSLLSLEVRRFWA